MTPVDPAEALAREVRRLLAGHATLKDVAAALRRHEDAVSTRDGDVTDRGIPILRIDAKLAAFRECLFSAYSVTDALGHAVDLLAFAVEKFCSNTTSGGDEAEARELVETYAQHPTPILDPSTGEPR